MITLKVKLKLNVNGVIEEQLIVGMLILLLLDFRFMQLEDFRKSEFIYINEKSVCDENDDNILEKIIVIKNFVLIFGNILRY